MRSRSTKTSRTFAWQKKLLPYMLGILIGLAIFFFIASLAQIFYLHSRIEDSPTVDLKPVFSSLEIEMPEIPEGGDKENIPEIFLPFVTPEEKLDQVIWQTLATLEVHAINQRYHQANVFLMSRVWTKYLGFVTGMMLALVGAAFILGKLRETESKLDATSSLWKFSFTTASPGLMLSLLGTILMITTIFSYHKIETKDQPLYTSLWLYKFVTRDKSSQQGLPPVMSDSGMEELLKTLEEDQLQDSSQ
ncbi:MAG: hypothetical protein WBB67_09080 [bacterium]